MFGFEDFRGSGDQFPRSALVVEDDERECAGLAGTLEARGFSVTTANSSADLIALIGRHHLTLVVIRHDFGDPEIDRATALSRMFYPDTRIIFTTGDPEQLSAGQDERMAVLARPVDPLEFARCLDRIALC